MAMEGAWLGRVGREAATDAVGAEWGESVQLRWDFWRRQTVRDWVRRQRTSRKKHCILANFCEKAHFLPQECFSAEY